MRRRRLVDKVKGEGKAAEVSVEVPVVPKWLRGSGGRRAGIEIDDGVLLRPGGEPPTATTKGWGRVPGR